MAQTPQGPPTSAPRPPSRPYKGKATQMPGVGGYANEWPLQGPAVPQGGKQMVGLDLPAGFTMVPPINLGEGGINTAISASTSKVIQQSLAIKSTPTLSLQAIGVQPGRRQPTNYQIPILWRAYKTNEMVFAAVEIKAQSAINPRLMVQDKTGQDGEWAEVEGHAMRMLMMRPNPEMDEAGFTRAYFTSTDSTGLFYAEITRNERSGLPEGLWPLDPGCVTPIQRADGAFDYEYRVSQGQSAGMVATIKGENMLVKRVYDPQSRLGGLSRLAVAMGSVDADSAQTEYIREFFNNGGIPSGIIKIKGKRLSEAQAQELGAKWARKYGRQTGRMHAPAVMDEEADYTKIGANLDELESQNIRAFTESRICMVFGIPPLIIYSYTGLLRATYSNLKEAWDNYWNGTLYYAYTEYRSWLTWNLLSQFVGEDPIKAERIRLWWDFSNVPYLQEDNTARQDRAMLEFQAGALTLNELRVVLGEDPDPQGDYYLRDEHKVAVPAGTAPADMPQAPGTQPAGTEKAGTVAITDVVPSKAYPYLAQLEQAIKTRATRASLQHQVERLASGHIATDWQAVIDTLVAQPE